MVTGMLRDSSLREVLDGVEDLLLDAASDPMLIVGDDELAAIKVAEDVITRAIEDGKAVSLDQFTADVLYGHNVVDPTDFVGDAFPGI